MIYMYVSNRQCLKMLHNKLCNTDIFKNMNTKLWILKQFKITYRSKAEKKRKNVSMSYRKFLINMNCLNLSQSTSALLILCCIIKYFRISSNLILHTCIWFDTIMQLQYMSSSRSLNDVSVNRHCPSLTSFHSCCGFSLFWKYQLSN